MPVQRFAPMSKDFATFDCDAHVTEPPLIWERAAEFLTRDELAALKTTIWWDDESRQLIVHGRAGVGIGSPRRGGIPGTMRVISNAGPGVKHDIQRALNVRNLNAKTALTQDQVSYIDFAGSYEPEPRLRDMDVQGIDQVMIIPTDIDTYPWLLDAVGGKAFCKAYNQWAYEFTRADPDRLFFAALLPMQNPQFAVQEVHRVAAQGCRVALVRPTDAMGNYPLQPKYEPVWDALEETGMVYGMHPFPAGAALKPPGYSEQYSGAELIRRTISSSGIPHSFLTNVQNFQSEAALWVTTALMTGLFDRHPRLNAAVFEASSTWLSFLLDECDKNYRLYRNERTLPPLKKLPSETFFEHCMTGFEGDEAPPPRFPEFYRDILIWSSDVYHHDGDDAWRAMETMRKFELPVADMARFLGGNARRLYRIDPPKTIIRDRVTEIERPNWWPTDEEVKASLAADARDQLVKGARAMTGFPVFDSDSHIVEPPELWERYLDPEYRVLGKHALWRHHGETNSYLKINGDVVRDTMNPNIPRHAIWRPGMTWDDVGALDAKVRHEMNPGAYDPRARLADMDRMGVDQAFLYPTWFAEGFPLVSDPDTALALARAYNDWIADFCATDPRLFAAAMLPLQDMDLALAELRRVAGNKSFRGAFIRPMFVKDNYFTSPYFDPLWAELETLGLVAAVQPTPGLWNPEWTSHGPFVEKIKNRSGQTPLPAGGGGPFSGGGAGLASTSFFTAFPQLGHPMAPILSGWLDNHMFAASVLIGFTVMQRFPGMKVVLAHGKASWMEEVLEKMEASSRVIPLLHKYPVRTDTEEMWEAGNVMLGFDAEERFIQKMPLDFAEKAVWGSRYPRHDTTSAHDAIAMLTRAGVADDIVARLMGGNAAEQFGVQLAQRVDG